MKLPTYRYIVFFIHLKLIVESRCEHNQQPKQAVSLEYFPDRDVGEGTDSYTAIYCSLLEWKKSDLFVTSFPNLFSSFYNNNNMNKYRYI
jgi:hypothetical protein